MLCWVAYRFMATWPDVRFDGRHLHRIHLRFAARLRPTASVELVVAQGITVVEAPATIYTEMLGASEDFGLDFGSLRVCISGGPALPEEPAVDMRSGSAAFCWRATDLGSRAGDCFNRPGKLRKVGSVGPPLSGIQTGWSTKSAPKCPWA